MTERPTSCLTRSTRQLGCFHRRAAANWLGAVMLRWVNRLVQVLSLAGVAGVYRQFLGEDLSIVQFMLVFALVLLAVLTQMLVFRAENRAGGDSEGPVNPQAPRP